MFTYLRVYRLNKHVAIWVAIFLVVVVSTQILFSLVFKYQENTHIPAREVNEVVISPKAGYFIEVREADLVEFVVEKDPEFANNSYQFMLKENGREGRVVLDFSGYTQMLKVTKVLPEGTYYISSSDGVLLSVGRNQDGDIPKVIFYPSDQLIERNESWKFLIYVASGFVLILVDLIIVGVLFDMWANKYMAKQSSM